jgi:O-antigen/teichoic acid export membrane protein
MGVAEGRRVRIASLRHSARPAVWLLGGVAGAAIGTYVYLIVVAREVGAQEYASFSSFWAVMIILGTGVYIPIEQETARRGVDLEVRPHGRTLLWSAMAAALVITCALTVVLLVTWPVVASFFGNEIMLGVALALGGLAYAVQCPVKGVLSAQREYRRYASVLGAEALLRVLLVLALVVVTDRRTGVLATVVGAAALGSALVGRFRLRPHPSAGPLPVLRSASVLVTGAVALQTLLYSGVVVARLLAPAGEEAAAGQLLAAIVVARIPVFVFQSIEALVVPRVAELAFGGDARQLRVAVRGLVLLVAALALATTVGCGLLGPQVVSLMFGSDFTVTHSTMALLGLGTGVFMLAVVASDITVSLRGHREMAVCWVVSLAVAILSIFWIPTFELKVTMPLVVGSLTAGVLLARAARARITGLVPMAA